MSHSFPSPTLMRWTLALCAAVGVAADAARGDDDDHSCSYANVFADHNNQEEITVTATGGWSKLPGSTSQAWQVDSDTHALEESAVTITLPILGDITISDEDDYCGKHSFAYYIDPHVSWVCMHLTEYCLTMTGISEGASRSSARSEYWTYTKTVSVDEGQTTTTLGTVASNNLGINGYCEASTHQDSVSIPIPGHGQLELSTTANSSVEGSIRIQTQYDAGGNNDQAVEIAAESNADEPTDSDSGAVAFVLSKTDAPNWFITVESSLEFSGDADGLQIPSVPLLNDGIRFPARANAEMMILAQGGVVLGEITQTTQQGPQ